MENYSGWLGELSWLARGEVTQNLPDVRFVDICFLFLSFAYISAKREYNADSAIADKIWQYRRGGNLTTCRSKVLAAKHTASLQLLCTVGGNQARLDARTEFKILEPSPKGGFR